MFAFAFIVKERGAKRAWGGAATWGRTFKAGAGMEPEGPCAGRGPVIGGGRHGMAVGINKVNPLFLTSRRC